MLLEYPSPPQQWFAVNYYGRIYIFPRYAYNPLVYGANQYNPSSIEEPYSTYSTPTEQAPDEPYLPPNYDNRSYQDLQQDVFCPRDPALMGDLNLEGLATYYNPTGNRTANGEFYDGTEFTAASPYIPGTTRPKYPFGSLIRVIDESTGNSIVVRINDTGSFGKFSDNRVIDLSPTAMRALTGRLGSTRVRIEAA